MSNKSFEIYSRIDSIDVPNLINTGDSQEWPKGKKYKVNCNGQELYVQTFFSRTEEKVPFTVYDAYSAIESMHARELKPEEIQWEHEGPQYADPAFDTDKLNKLNKDQIRHRLDFMNAITNLINNQDTMEAIVQAATKKKNGTFHKGRIIRIACSGIADDYDRVFALIGRAKKDDSMSITFEDVMVKPGDNDLWANDFISTYHEGLPVSEALGSILECKYAPEKATQSENKTKNAKETHKDRNEFSEIIWEAAKSGDPSEVQKAIRAYNINNENAKAVLKAIKEIDFIDCSGKAFVFAGGGKINGIDYGEIHNPAAEMVKERGGVVRNAISGKTDYFVIHTDDNFVWIGAKVRDAAKQIGKRDTLTVISLENLVELLK